MDQIQKLNQTIGLKDEVIQRRDHSIMERDD